jgi:hypothetical protein
MLLRFAFVVVCLNVGPMLYALGSILTLHQGEKFSFEFNALPYLDPQANWGNACTIRFVSGSLTSSETMLVELFPNSLSETATSWSISGIGSGENFAATYVWPGSQPFWADLQGMLRFTMIGGSASIERVIVTQVVNNEVYQGVLSVPEPSSCGLFLAGLFLILRRRGRFVNHAHLTRHSVVLSTRCVPSAGSLSLGRRQQCARPRRA